MSSQPQQERLLNLLALLLHADQPVPFHVIYNQLEGYAELEIDSARRSFTRDIHTMREMGVPILYIEQDTDQGGYEIPKEYYYLPRLDFSDSERALLSQIFWMTEKTMKSPLFRALHKLHYDQGLSLNFDQEPVLSVTAERQDPRLGKLSSAIAHGKTICFEYQSIQSEQGATRTLDPYGLGYYNNHWYLVGYCHRRQDIRCFKVTRIQGKIGPLNKRLERDFEIPENFRIHDYIGSLKPQKTSHSFSVKIRFEAQIAWMIQEQFFEKTTTLLEDGALLLEVQDVSDAKMIFHLVAPYFHFATILEPEWLRQDFYKLLKETYLATDPQNKDS